MGDEGQGGSPVVQGMETMGLPSYLGPDVLAARVRLARVAKIGYPT